MCVQFKGRTLRVNRAMGDMPSWQKGPTRAAPQGGAALSGGENFNEHPKVQDSQEQRPRWNIPSDSFDALFSWMATVVTRLCWCAILSYPDSIGFRGVGE